MNEEHKVHTEESLNASISEFDFKPKRVTLEPKLTDRIQQPLPYKKELKEAELMLIMENDKATRYDAAFIFFIVYMKMFLLFYNISFILNTNFSVTVAKTQKDHQKKV